MSAEREVRSHLSVIVSTLPELSSLLPDPFNRWDSNLDDMRSAFRVIRCEMREAERDARRVVFKRKVLRIGRARK